MAFAEGKSSVSLSDVLSRVTEGDILSFYLNITKIPIIINSPLRKDNKPSFGLYSTNGEKIQYIDFSTRDRGGIIDLLEKLWNCDFEGVINKIHKDIPQMNSSIVVNKSNIKPIISINCSSDTSELQCKVREWKDYDLEYWNSYGISLKWLKYAEVYPISHKIITKNNKTYTIPADKLAYAYVEHKENKVTLKIYQPLNKNGFKWSSKHDKSVVSLWTKIPEKGNILCICASLKDALCLSANTGIPAIATQGEGYSMSKSAINNLKSRYKKIFILFDNDEAGLKNGKKLEEQTGFTNIILPNKYEEKDVSDLYHSLQDKQKFSKVIKGLFNPYL